jgi:hypothetical protein
VHLSGGSTSRADPIHSGGSRSSTAAACCTCRSTIHAAGGSTPSAGPERRPFTSSPGRRGRCFGRRATTAAVLRMPVPGPGPSAPASGRRNVVAHEARAGRGTGRS